MSQQTEIINLKPLG